MRRLQWAVLFLLLLCSARQALADANLLQNSGFEQAGEAGPDAWLQDMWRFEPGVSILERQENGRGSAYCAMIENRATNDARFVQTVAVKPNTLYHLGGWVKTEGLPDDGGGAGFSIIGSYQLFPRVYDTGGEWRYLACWVRTHDQQQTMDVAARLGFYEGDTTGTAFFDDITLAEVDAAPEGFDEIVLENFHPNMQTSEEQPPNHSAMRVFLWIAGAGAMLFVSYLILSARRPRLVADRAAERAAKLIRATPPAAHMRLTDWAILLGLTAVYAAIAFIGLGATAAPQTEWVSTGMDDEIIFDLGEVKPFYMLYYGGIHWWDRTFPVAFSDDGIRWTNDVFARMYEGDCFTWQYLSPRIQTADAKSDWAASPMLCHARYVRIGTDGPQLTLMEVAFRDMQGGLLEVASVATSGNAAPGAFNAARLTDEQDTVPENPSYFSGTYFDEIYHVRTAYEHANALPTYEWTHPPLGKVFIMLGIKLFGMTPFGWRFMGALAGVLMVPAMYLLGKLLFKRTRYALLAAFVMAFDMMHLTQTRIATIDSYAVLFILLMYLCMFHYMRMSFFTDGYRTLLPLFLSGLFMGLGCASKWIGMYAGVGLAILFAWTMARRYLEWRAGLASTDEAIRARARAYPRYMLATLLACILFFIIIPVVIYYLSYIPHFAADGGLTWSRFWHVQQQMFSYHSGLKEGHPYMSAWYDWPLILRPMWYYSGPYVQEGYVSTILSMGNPAVWWVGAIAFVYVLYRWLRPHFSGIKVTDHRPAMLLLAFAAQFVPWMLVTRAIFIYHYFGSLPFVMLSIVFALEQVSQRHPRAATWLQGSYMLAVFLLFIGFYPLATGIPVPLAWAEAMNWLQALHWQHLNYGFWLRY